MATLYARTAANSPVPIAPSAQALLTVAAGTVTEAETIAPGATTISAPFNKHARRSDLAGRFGGGSYAVVKGLTLSQTVSGQCLVASGQGMLDGISEIGTATQKALTSSQKNWLFLLPGGAVSVVASASAPAAPASICCYLGMLDVDGSGNFTNVDLSGVFTLQGGVSWRKTADAGLPTDTPPSGISFFTKTAHSLYWWDGTAYYEISDGMRAERQSLPAMTDANYTPGSAIYTARILEVPASLTLTADRNLVLPTIDGWEWTIANLSAGAHNIVPKTAAGTGPTVGNGKVARVYCDGTNIRRATPDA
jgi:hypothetical protein